jgi:hypothetical protein
VKIVAIEVEIKMTVSIAKIVLKEATVAKEVIEEIEVTVLQETWVTERVSSLV